ncbi:radical SAM protein [Salmonella enterica]|nr:radical SAM protein [Salmonella enterica]EFO5648738.1 radical SAM protein [Salmonella enterica subsp. enterica serovar Miami]EAT1014603.1 radical SAM protein [Salmonella enterica]EBB2055423.1 radical SAM protein [Salmonella enterica]EBN0646551.1 radical SAM protein [Salmonella enterica]
MTICPPSFWDEYPHTATIITTYTCTASCKDCCFECSPASKARLKHDEIINFLDTLYKNFKSIKLVVFTGGECFLLGKSLFDAINYATNLGFMTRCVTNGYWGKEKNSARQIAKRLALANLTEINISTGKDHAEWVPLEYIINAAEALNEYKIKTLIVVEQDTSESKILNELISNERVSVLINSERVKIHKNIWVPFHKDSIKRKETNFVANTIDKPCEQVFENIVLTPNNEISSCCGLTMEHIPEMKLGYHDEKITPLLFQQQTNDFVKIWIRTEGPYKILKENFCGSAIEIDEVIHPCQACVHLYQNKVVRENIKNKYIESVGRIIKQFNVNERLKLELIAIDKQKNKDNI